MLKEYKDYPVIDKKCIYTPQEIEEMLGISKTQTYKLIKSGSFPVRKIGVKYLVAKDVFDSWLRESGSSL